MTGLIETTTEGRLGIITLNRPEAINALSGPMIASIVETLEAWRGDDAVRAVLFEGNGNRGFCAGGDVRAAREYMLSGRQAEAEAYFGAEYAMNALIAGYEKPVVALTHGAVMGGGIGIAGHAKFRFTSMQSRFAMPEAAIGFVVDTGVNAILARALPHRALAFLMVGIPVGPADAFALGLTDCVVQPEAMAGIKTELVVASEAADIETTIVTLMQSEGVEPGEPEFCEAADALELVFEEATAGQVVHAALGSGTEERLGTTLLTRSPTSLEAILQSHRAARSMRGIDDVLALDFALARYLVAEPDFCEGVRAVLVDKDQKPQWSPADFGGVRVEAIREVVAAARLPEAAI
ncbi:enoyl-CoA hydratase/isomerase family protein [Paradevosia shaoguanensis]|uniref:enoyl-CoA hydratase/isomerase family protein n=1 Tax=Paradevosia shaoguanensis TaxID=1335043 RepID=UPI001934402F|nr:enoyl-CoA hydratase/isomerase family protein [Paradevosia shaoguanensis]